MRQPPASLTLLAAALVVAACSNATPPSSVSEADRAGSAVTDVAQTMCDKALGAGKVVSAGPMTTLGDLRSMRQGPGFQPAKDAFPGSAADDAAAFCWTKGDADLYDSFGVTTDGQRVKLVSVGGMTAPTSGPPVVP